MSQMDRIPLAYTFGNHMHWVDMEWLWGYHVMPGSVRDMIRLCREAGIKGCVNFDGVGYEKLASEDPEAFAELKEAIQSGLIEPVGCSYGQPYGLFHGGESNVRQRIYGVRTCMRLFGVRPRTFWEEEFDFFPQLPQMLSSCGFTGASLYFQWTWHTPEIPREDDPVIRWQGIDGSSLPTATRSRLNLHQWPEDMDILLDDLAKSPPAGRSLILQWLELMPSKDWMCRSELILPKLKELMADPRFEIEPMTLGQYLSGHEGAPTKSYSMDEVWHGMTLGKNGDRMREASRKYEWGLLNAESLAACLSLFGRPYRQWDVYPTWELEEGWRHLLMAQHHDNDECEGLCGHVGLSHYATAFEMAKNVLQAQRKSLLVSGRMGTSPDGPHSAHGPFGWRTDSAESKPAVGSPVRHREVTADQVAEAIRGIAPWLPDLAVSWSTEGIKGASLATTRSGLPCIHLTLTADYTKPKPGLNDSLQVKVEPGVPFRILTDQPYSVQEVHPTRSWPKKYPTGDWMTSPQWFETVERPFTSLRFVDIVGEDGQGLLIIHSTCQQWFRDEDGVRAIVSAYDPWDEDYYVPGIQDLAIVPHGPMSNAKRWALAHDRLGYATLTGQFPVSSFSPVSVDAQNVLPTAFYREIEEFSGRGLENYAGSGMEYPFVLRLVEFDGIGGEIEVTLPGPIAKAFKTNLLGEIETELQQQPGDMAKLSEKPEELEPFGIRAETVRFAMRPYEIATLYIDIVPGRKVARDLDAKREIWATVHRV